MFDSTRNRFYVLDEEGTPVPEPDVLKWARSFVSDRTLKQDELSNGTVISTVFLGINHSWDDRGPPILWETMIFGGSHDEDQYRYSSREAALAGHDKAVALASGIQAKN